MNVKHHAHKVLGLEFVEITALINIILLPDLVNNVLDDLFVSALVFESLEKCRCVYSLLIWLPNEGTQQDLWHIFSRDELDLHFLVGILIQHDSGLGIFHELIEWSRVFIGRLGLVEENSTQVDYVEQIRYHDIIWKSDVRVM